MRSAGNMVRNLSFCLSFPVALRPDRPPVVIVGGRSVVGSGTIAGGCGTGNDLGRDVDAKDGDGGGDEGSLASDGREVLEGAGDGENSCHPGSSERVWRREEPASGRGNRSSLSSGSLNDDADCIRPLDLGVVFVRGD